MIALFKQKSPANIVLVFIFGLLIKLPLFLYPKLAIATSADGRLYHAFAAFINRSGAIGVSVVAFLLIYGQALMVNYLINEYRMTSRQTFLPAMAYMLLTSLWPDWSFMSSALLANTFVILFFLTLFRLYNTNTANSKIFNIGLLAGIASFIFFPSALFGISVILGLMILRPFRLNEVFLFLMGFTTPYYFYGVYLFLTNSFTPANFFPHLYLQVPPVQRSLWLVGSTLFACIPFLMGGYYIQVHLRKMLIQARKNWSILLVYLMVAFFIPFINSTASVSPWLLAVVPFATFHACAFLYPTRKALPLFIFFAMLIFILAQQYFSNIWH